VVTQFVDDLVHLEGSSDGLNQHRTTDGSPGDANIVLGKVEDVVPQSRLQMGLHLGQIEVRPEPASHQLLGIVEEIETEIEQTTGDGLAIHREVLLI
jgi:hypothetical protein